MVCVSVSQFVFYMMGKRSLADREEKPRDSLSEHMQESFKRIKVDDTTVQESKTVAPVPVYFSARLNTRGHDTVEYSHNNELGNLVQQRREVVKIDHDIVNYSEMNRVLGQRYRK